MTPEQRKLVEEARDEARALFQRSGLTVSRDIAAKLAEALAEPEPERGVALGTFDHRLGPA